MMNAVACPPNKEMTALTTLISLMYRRHLRNTKVYTFLAFPQSAPQPYETYRDLKALKPPRGMRTLHIHAYLFA